MGTPYRRARRGPPGARASAHWSQCSAATCNGYREAVATYNGVRPGTYGTCINELSRHVRFDNAVKAAFNNCEATVRRVKDAKQLWEAGERAKKAEADRYKLLRDQLLKGVDSASERRSASKSDFWEGV